MKVGLFYLVLVILVLRVNCDNGDEMRAKLEALEKHFAKMEVLERRQEASERRQDATERRLATVEQQQAVDSTSFFSVQLSADLQVAHEGTVVFDNVIVNYGSDYIQTGGIYIAPEDGYYMFTLVVRENGDNHAAGTVMRTLASDPNSAIMLCKAEQGDGPWQTGTCTVITELLSGDQVYVIADGMWADTCTCNSFYFADGYTSFTGLLVKSGLE